MFTSSKTVLELGIRYSVIAFAFTLIIIVGITFEKLFQAVGNMKTTMISLMCGCITNIVLDPVLILAMVHSLKWESKALRWQLASGRP